VFVVFSLPIKFDVWYNKVAIRTPCGHFRYYMIHFDMNGL